MVFKKGNKAWNEGIKGSKHSEETKIKMGKSHKGKIKTKEHLKNISEALKGFKHSKKSKKKMSESHTGKKLTKEHKLKIKKTNSNPNQVIIHHINGNHYDNRLENKIQITKREHALLHWKQGDLPQLGLKIKMENQIAI